MQKRGGKSKIGNKEVIVEEPKLELVSYIGVIG